MRAAAGLQVDAGDAQEAHAPGAARRLHAHRLDELGPRVQLLVGDPHRFRLDAAGDDLVRLALDFRGVEEAHVDVEVEPPLVGRDVAAGDRGDHHARHDVQRRVQAHERVAPLPGKLERDGFAGQERRHSGRRDVQHAVRAVALARIGDRRCARRSRAPTRRCRPAGRRPAGRRSCGRARCRARRRRTRERWPCAGTRRRGRAARSASTLTSPRAGSCRH